MVLYGGRANTSVSKINTNVQNIKSSPSMNTRTNSSSSYGGFGSKAAQQRALEQAMMDSYKKNPEQFKKYGITSASKAAAKAKNIIKNKSIKTPNQAANVIAKRIAKATPYALSKTSRIKINNPKLTKQIGKVTKPIYKPLPKRPKYTNIIGNRPQGTIAGDRGAYLDARAQAEAAKQEAINNFDFGTNTGAMIAGVEKVKRPGMEGFRLNSSDGVRYTDRLSSEEYKYLKSIGAI